MKTPEQKAEKKAREKAKKAAAFERNNSNPNRNTPAPVWAEPTYVVVYNRGDRAI